MSGQPGGDQNQNEQDRQPQGGQPQGGQPQGGQPQGGQPQGRQPQGGQPQGGQPQAAQPQGGQPPAGQPQGQYGAQSRGMDVDTALMQEWGIYGTILFALAGLGVGLFYFLGGAIDSAILEVSGGGQGFGGGGASFGSSPQILMVPGVAIFLAAFVGVAIARDTNLDDMTTIQVTAVVMAVGTLVAFIISGFLISTIYDNLSLAFGGLIINAIIAGLVAAGVGAGGVWTERNQAPQ